MWAIYSIHSVSVYKCFARVKAAASVTAATAAAADDDDVFVDCCSCSC